MGEVIQTAVPEEADLSKHFSSGYTVPEPEASAQSKSDIDKLGMIGVDALRDSGYFTRVVFQPSAPARKLLNPHNIRVLIIDDDKATASLIELTLHSAGCKTRVARTCQEIADGLGAKPLPHLVLLDILMPEMNGFDLLNRIRQHPALQKIPVMLLTALADRKDVSRGLSLGADGYITKPVLPSVLLKAVEAVIGG